LIPPFFLPCLHFSRSSSALFRAHWLDSRLPARGVFLVRTWLGLVAFFFSQVGPLSVLCFVHLGPSYRVFELLHPDRLPPGPRFAPSRSTAPPPASTFFFVTGLAFFFCFRHMTTPTDLAKPSDTMDLPGVVALPVQFFVPFLIAGSSLPDHPALPPSTPPLFGKVDRGSVCVRCLTSDPPDPFARFFIFFFFFDP